MTIHNVMLNPFNVSESKKRDSNAQNMSLNGHIGGVNAQEYLELMKNSTIKNQTLFYQFDQELHNFDSWVILHGSPLNDTHIITACQHLRIIRFQCLEIPAILNPERRRLPR